MDGMFRSIFTELFPLNPLAHLGGCPTKAESRKPFWRRIPARAGRKQGGSRLFEIAHVHSLRPIGVYRDWLGSYTVIRT